MTTPQLPLRKSRHLVGLRTVGTLPVAPVIPQLGGFAVVALEAAAGIDRALDEVRQEEAVEVGTHIYFAGDDRRPIVPTGLLYCHLAAGVRPTELRPLIRHLGLEELEWQDEDTVLLSVTARSRNPLHVAATLSGLAMVDRVVPDLDVPLDQYFSEPRDGLFGEQWCLDNDGSVPGVAHFPLKPGADARVRAAWHALGSLGSDRITIAVIDNGFDLEHPDLSSRVVHPLSVHANRTELPAGPAYGDHGTPCASIALAPANGIGIVGVAPNARLMPLHGLTYSAFLTQRMFDHCTDRGADIISCSWGTVDARFRPGRYHERAIRKATTQGRNGKGCIILFAAGNEGRDYLNYYCQLPGVIAVGASNSNDDHPSYSNRGPELSVVAPSDGGWPILAARASWDTGDRSQSGPRRYYVDGKDRGPHHKHFGGTSSATPLVAGICALLLSANPELTSAQVKAILERTADKIGPATAYDARGHSERFGYGRVNAEAAVREAARLATNLSPASPPKPPTGYGIQVGAYGKPASAETVKQRLSARFTLPLTVHEKGGLYRVFLGEFTTAEAARSWLPELKQAGYTGFVRDLSGLG